MKPFNLSVNTKTTYVKIQTNPRWFKVSDINESRTLIKVNGLSGFFESKYISKIKDEYR